MKFFILLAVNFFTVLQIGGMTDDHDLALINYAKNEVSRAFNRTIDDYIEKIEKGDGKDEYKIFIQNKILYLNFVSNISLQNRKLYMSNMWKLSKEESATYEFIYVHLGDEHNPGFFVTKSKQKFGLEIFNYSDVNT